MGALAELFLRVQDRLDSAIRTAAGRRASEMGDGSRVIQGGRIFNIGRRCGAITIGENSLIAGDLLTFAHGGEVAIGNWCYVGSGSRVWSAASIRIGDRVLISHGVNIHDSDSHPKDPAQRHAQFRQIATVGHPLDPGSVESAPVYIEDDVWIGFNATILKGVRIGARTIVAAGTTVTKDIEPDSVVIGPVVRTRT